MIEFRLASFTVKSRRYVDFSSAGYYMPEGLDEALTQTYATHMEALFADRAAARLGVALVHAVEALEDAALMLRRDADARVAPVSQKTIFTAQSPARTRGCDSTGCAAMPARSCTIRLFSFKFMYL